MPSFSKELRVFTVTTEIGNVDFTDSEWSKLFDFLSGFIATFFLRRGVELSPIWNCEMELGEIIASVLALPAREGESRIFAVRESFGEESFLHTPYLHPCLDFILPS